SGSLYLYGDNSALTHGIFLNTSAGVNFNNSKSFGSATTPINFLDAATATSLGLSAPTNTFYVLANPDTTSPLTIPNPVTMRSDADTTLIYTGHDPVTFSGTWTIGSTAGGRYNRLQIGNTPFPSAEMIISGGIAGDSNSNLTVQSPNGVNGTLVVEGSSTYGGITTLGQITAAAPSTGTPAFQADDGVGLPTASILALNGGVLQTHGTFSRPLAADFGQNVAWFWPATQTAPGGGGFSAIGSQLTVNINGNLSQLSWGESMGDVGVTILGPLKFGSPTSNAETLFQNPIDLNGLGSAGVTRTITVIAGAGGDSTVMSGVISNSGQDIGLTKNGTGTLIFNANNTYGGATSVAAGTLLVNGTQTGTGLTTVAAGATLGGTGTLGGGVTNDGTVNPGAGVGTLHVNGNVTMDASSHYAVDLSGATADKLAITGNLDLSAVGDFLDVTGTGTGSSWIIATYTGTLTGNFDTVTSGYTVDYGTGTNSQVTLMAAAALPGDFNTDGKVDAADYVIWRKGGSPNPNSPGDYSLWRTNFGTSNSGSGSALASNASAVPEPSSVILCLLGIAAFVSSASRRQA
ncbi:MAG TPA: autotransporter-associated beta strand repeat-containing protein, partial [Lacipirellulaceae bacterium]|nr:autotransporter-associated beta strand repeat-containing protein [Lacipirellulaceae bacterium]